MCLCKSQQNLICSFVHYFLVFQNDSELFGEISTQSKHGWATSKYPSQQRFCLFSISFYPTGLYAVHWLYFVTLNCVNSICHDRIREKHGKCSDLVGFSSGWCRNVISSVMTVWVDLFRQVKRHWREPHLHGGQADGGVGPDRTHLTRSSSRKESDGDNMWRCHLL